MTLEEAGIPAWVADEVGGTIYSVGIGTRLQVRAKDEADASEVLAAAPISSEHLPPELAEPPCPACGSRNVAPEAWVDDKDRERPGWPASHRNWYYVCSDCNEAWPLEEPPNKPKS
jgi:hypothetical protein